MTTGISLPSPNVPHPKVY